MNYMSTKEAAEKWGYSVSTIRKWCKDGKIAITLNAKKINGHWQIPIEAECPKEKL